MKKIILGTVITAALAVSSVNAVAGLTLCSEKINKKIVVYCNGIRGIYSVPASKTNKNCTPNIAWMALISNFLGRTTLNCNFYKGSKDDANKVGSAILGVNLTSGKIMQYSYNHKKYVVDIKPKKAKSTYVNNMTVTITKA